MSRRLHPFFPARSTLRTNLLAGALLGLAACGGGSSQPGPVPGPPPPHWELPVDLGGTSYQNGITLAGDGHGGVTAAWLRAATSSATEVVATRMRSDGTWEAAQVLESATPPLVRQAPVAAVDSLGHGWVAWLATDSTSTQVAHRLAAIDLNASSAFGATTNALTLDQASPSGLQLAVGSDGSAMIAWKSIRAVSAYGSLINLGTVQASRMGTNGLWSPPASYHLNQLSHQDLLNLAGNGQGGYVLEYNTGDDAFTDVEAVGFTVGTGSFGIIPLWEPLVQVAMSAHTTALATDGQGGLEAWLLFAYDTKSYPRQGAAGGTWTVGDPVNLPLSATSLAVSREPNGTGWIAGTGGTDGLWVAPLSGVSIGTPRVLLGATINATALLAARDAFGHPALLWIQSQNGSVDGLGFTTWNGSSWSTPELVSGTAGTSITGLSVQAGPSGLVALWAEIGTTGLTLRSARWH